MCDWRLKLQRSARFEDSAINDYVFDFGCMMTHATSRL